MLVGLQKTTLVNFPGRVAAAVFLPGCNLSCPYCHNTELVKASVKGSELKSSGNNYYTIDEVYSFLGKRKNILSGLVISGGEPFISPVIFDLIRKAKELNLAVKIDTNGTQPDKLLKVLNSTELRPSMIALDIKTSLKRYEEVLPKSAKDNFSGIVQRILKTIEILVKDGIETEYRTVLIPGFVDKSEIEEIASVLPKNAVWKLANFVPGNCLNPDWNNIKPYTEKEIKDITNLALTFIKNTEFR